MSMRKVTAVQIPTGLGASQCMIKGNNVFKNDKDKYVDPMNTEMVSVEDLAKSVKTCEEQLNNCIKNAETAKKQRRTKSPVPINKRPPWGFHTPTREKSPMPRSTPETQSKQLPPRTPRENIINATAEKSVPRYALPVTSRKTSHQMNEQSNKDVVSDRITLLEKTVLEQAASIAELKSALTMMTEKAESMEANQRIQTLQMEERFMSLNSHVQFLLQTNYEGHPPHFFAPDSTPPPGNANDNSQSESAARCLNLSTESSGNINRLPPSPPIQLQFSEKSCV